MRCSVDEALAAVLYYNGLIEDNIDGEKEDALTDLISRLETAKTNCTYLLARDSELDYMGGESLDETLWIMLVEMFGDYGVSARTGWVEDCDGAIEWLKKLRAYCQVEFVEDNDG